MNREGAETYLRLLAEAEMRGPLAAARPRPRAGGPGGGTARMMAVAQALTTVCAIDAETAEGILADFELAVSVRKPHDQLHQGPGGSGLSRFGRPAWAMHRSRRHHPPSMAPAAASPAPPPPDGGADRFVPVGRTIPFHDAAISGELHLLSFAHTGSGARFIAAWDIRSLFLPGGLGLHHPDLIPFDRFTVADDRGTRYRLEFTPGGGPDWVSEVGLRPEPPPDIRWLDMSAPGDEAIRVELTARPGLSPPLVTETGLSPGEHLLVMLAERLLTVAPDFPQDLRQQLAVLSREPVQTLVFGLGEIIAGLEAADVLPPHSPLPGRLAAVCAGLRVSGHGITAPPAHDLPEPWLSLLAHYHRRKPDTAPVWEGYAAVAGALPELDGIRLALLGLHNADGGSSLHVLARGLTLETRPGPFGVELYFPLSLWLRDGAGRWHAARPAGCHRADGDHMVRLQLVPPLTRSAGWIDILAVGRSAEVRARLPLRWGFPT